MKKFSSLLLTLSLVLCILIALPLNSSASSFDVQGGLEVTISTDKYEYTADEDIQISVNINNNNSYNFKDVSIETMLPEGLELKEGELSLYDVEIDARSFYSTSVVAQLSDEATDGSSTNSDGSNKHNSKDNDSKSSDSDDGTSIILWVILIILLIAAVVGVVLIFKFNKTTQTMCLFLCFAMLLTMGPVSAFAAEKKITTITVETTVVVNEQEYTITSVVSNEKKSNSSTNKDNKDNNDNNHSVTFALNDGSNGSYRVQMVEDGTAVAKPEEPKRLDCSFTGWYTEKGCFNAFDFSTKITQDITLYAGWNYPENDEYLFGGSSGGGTTFSITGIEMSNKYVCTTVNVNSSCTLQVQFLNETTEKVITTITTQTPVYCELTPICMLVEEVLPQKYIIVANLLDSNGNKLCNSFTCITYTTAYEKHAKQTVNDFKGQTVINFDENPNKNYGVLSADVKEITISETTNKFTVSPQPITSDNHDGTQEIEYKDYFIFENPSVQVTSLTIGDKIYIKGTQHLIKIASIEKSNNGTVTISASDDVELPDFYSVLNVDMEFDVENAKINDSDMNAASDIIDKEASTSISTEFTLEINESLKAELKLSGTAKVNVEVTYDLKLFKKDYVYISVVAEFEFKLNAEIKVHTGNDDKIDASKVKKEVKEIKLGKWTIPTPVTGLTISTTPKIPIEWELSGGVTFEFNTKTKSGLEYSSYDGVQEIDKKERTIKISAEGEASVKIGPKVELSLGFCGKVLKASVAVSAGIEAKLKVEIAATDTTATTAESFHACSLCIDGKINWYAEVTAEFSYQIIKDILDGKIKRDIIKITGNFPISPNFYISIINDSNSILNGLLTFGWGECPNELYKTEIIVKDTAGDELSNIDISITTPGGDDVTAGKSKLKVYLYDGYYMATCNIGGIEINKSFTVTGSAQTITLNVSPSGILSGKICKASDRTTAISGAKIKIFKNSVPHLTKRSDSSGNYSINLAEGEYLIVISSAGYIDFKAYASVVADTCTYMETFLMVEGEEGSVGIASGTVVNSLTGIGAPDVLLSILPDWNNNSESANVITTTRTDADGKYQIQLPIGNYTVMATKSNYTTSFFNIIVQNGTTANQNGTITPIVAEGSGDKYLITLTWDENPRDLDSHVEGTLSNGAPFHVFYLEQNQYDGDTEVCNLDYDDIDSYGPEHITLTTTTDKPYYYYIHRYAGDGAIVTSGAQITVEQGNTLIAKFNVPTDLSSDDYWNVFAIKNGELIVNNTITTSPDVSYAN